MSDSTKSWQDLVAAGDEMKMDYRLMEKKVEEGFLTREEFQNYLKSLQSEAEYDFTSAEALDAETPEA
ncbi:MAG: hypothetical protein ACO3LE_01310 [Bdellovibrionota bacterium]